jgi:citrate synthase
LISVYARHVTRFVGAAEAARQLGVRTATLYAYVSRGLVERRVAVDGRTSLYSVDDLERLASRGRSRREVAARPSLDVQIVSSITTLDEQGPRYRGRDAAELARSAGYEQVAELLWGGPLHASVEWALPAAADVRLARRIAALVGGSGIPAITAVALALGHEHPGDDAPTAGRRLLTVIPDVIAGDRPVVSSDPRLPARLAAAWRPDAGPAFASVIKRALVVMADHELTTSTLAVRLAASVRASPYDAIVAGLAVVRGPLHGAAAGMVHALLEECARDGVVPVITRRLAARERLPGFGHKIYAGDDPRLIPLREALSLLDDTHGRLPLVEEVVAAAGMRVTQRPNVDLGMGGLTYVTGLPGDVPIFAIARIAGFVAHYLEESTERPVRYRGIARPAV